MPEAHNSRKCVWYVCLSTPGPLGNLHHSKVVVSPPEPELRRKEPWRRVNTPFVPSPFSKHTFEFQMLAGRLKFPLPSPATSSLDKCLTSTSGLENHVTSSSSKANCLTSTSTQANRVTSTCGLDKLHTSNSSQANRLTSISSLVNVSHPLAVKLIVSHPLAFKLIM